MKKRIWKVSKTTILIFLTLILAGFIYEQISRFYYDLKKPDKSEFIEVDGRKIHFKKQGTGSCTIIFESGLGGDYLHWKEIQSELSKKHTTLSYDKAGILWSGPTNEISLKRYATDLKMLLQQTKCPKPYILVGHSFGGITSRLFIKENNKDIAGIVFVDVSHPQQLKKASLELKNSVQPPPRKLLSFLNEIGIIRILYTFTPFTKTVPQEHWFNQNVKNYFYRIFKGLMQEMENDNQLMAEADKITDFGAIPLTLITAKYPDGVEGVKDKKIEKEYLALHNALQKDLLRLSKNSQQIFAEKSGHYITLQQPDLICKTITELVP